MVALLPLAEVRPGEDGTLLNTETSRHLPLTSYGLCQQTQWPCQLNAFPHRIPLPTVQGCACPPLQPRHSCPRRRGAPAGGLKPSSLYLCVCVMRRLRASSASLVPMLLQKAACTSASAASTAAHMSRSGPYTTGATCLRAFPSSAVQVFMAFSPFVASQRHTCRAPPHVTRSE